MMKKFLNSPKQIVPELLAGYTLAYHEKVRLIDHDLIARTVPKAAGKVGVVAMSSSGHEPGICGFVGKGMLDVAVLGEMFAAPGPPRCLDALKIADRGAGVLLIVLNHTGDLVTANMVMEKVKQARMPVKMLLVHDDISIAPRNRPELRRGLVGCLPIYKIAGAAAERGLSLEDIYAITERMGNNLSTFAVAIRTATHPSTGKAMFALGEQEMELGMGIHGEPGTGKIPMQTADEIADLMVAKLLDDLQVKPDEKLLVILNSAGATSLMELFILYQKVHQILTSQQIVIADSRIGEYMTTQEQAGFSITFGRMDLSLQTFWRAPCDAPYFTVR